MNLRVVAYDKKGGDDRKQREMPVWADITKVLTGYYGFCYVGNEWIGIPD